MGMTMTQKILARHAGLEHVVPGQLVEGKLDLVLGNDITTPVAIAEFNKAGLTQVFDREKIALVLDHYTPCKDIKASRLCAQVREFAKRFDITHFYDVGCMGVERSGNTLYIYSADLKLLLCTHDVTWSRRDSFCAGQYDALMQPEEFPTAPVQTQIQQLPKPSGDLSFAKFDFDGEEPV